MMKKKNKKRFTTRNNKNVLHSILSIILKERSNTIKSVHFTNLETSPMASAVIEGYINENKEDDFTAMHRLHTIISVAL